MSKKFKYGLLFVFMDLTGWWLYWLWHKTVRISVSGQMPTKEPVIYGFWHQHIFIIVGFFSKTFARHSITALVSPSPDGKILSRLLNKLHIRVCRGSSDINGLKGFWSCIREIRSGKSLMITPDGPRGPSEKMKPGIIKLSEITRAPVSCITAEYSSCWRLSSWDGFIIPKPFSRCTLRFTFAETLTETECESLLNGSQAGRSVEKPVA